MKFCVIHNITIASLIIDSFVILLVLGPDQRRFHRAMGQMGQLHHAPTRPRSVGPQGP